MTDDLDHLPTSLWLDVKLRILTNRGGSYYMIQKGPAEGGAVLLKVYVPGEGAQIFTQIRDMDGRLTWMEVFENEWVDEQQADQYIARQVDIDPDLWALEVESRSKSNPFEDDE